MKVYISGPINSEIEGVSDEEKRERFDLCMEWIVINRPDWEPINPLRVGACEDGSCGGQFDGHDWECWLRFDLKALLECQAIVMLPGHEYSRGANLEKHVAQAIGLHPFFANEKGEIIA